MGVTIEAERRHLTVLFCDLVGSTELSTKIDAEEFSEVVQEYQHRAVSVARSFGGDVEAYSGDGIVFRFGWPEAHDDDAERALRAALEIVAVVSRDDLVRARVGVNSGVTVVGEMGAPGRRSTMALGQTMNLAARLQAVADPGTVVASAATVDLVRDGFTFEALGGQHLKGIAQPVEAFRVVSPHRVRDRLATRSGGLKPFIGRQSELDLLADRWASTLNGEGSAVLVIGEPGVGKSRLVHEMRTGLSGTPHRLLECSCSSYTQMSALWPLVQLIEQELHLHPDEDRSWQLDRVRRGLETAGVADPDALGLVADLLAIPGAEVSPMSPERRRDKTIDVLLTWLVALAGHEPLVMVIEDLHWCDPTSLDLIGRLLDERAAPLPLLLLMTARPEFIPGWKTDGTLVTVPLEPLDDHQLRQLVDNLGGGRALPGPVVDRIVGTAAGIPLFAEEVGRSVLESGLLVAEDRQWRLAAPVDSLEIPRTLQSSLLARLDRLGPAKAVAQVAAVIGRAFSFDLLLAVTAMDPGLLSERLAQLTAAELLFVETSVSAEAYVFKHALIQEIAYESLLRRTRRSVHDRIARALLQSANAGAHVASEVIARHFEAAGAVREASEHYHLAATTATDQSAYREAIVFLRHGLALIEDQSVEPWKQEIEIEMRLALCSAIIATRSYADPEIETEYARVRDLCEGAGEDPRVGSALVGLSIFHTNRGRPALGADLAERVLEIARAQGDGTLELLGSVQLALPCNYLGRAAECVRHARRAISLYDLHRHRGIAQRFGTDQGVAAHVFAGWGCLVQGCLDEGMAHLDDAVDLAVRLGHPFHLVYALFFKASGHWERGEGAETLRAARRAREIAEEQGFAFWTGVTGVWEMAEHVIQTGDCLAVPKVIEAGLVAGESGNRGGSTVVMARVAEAAQAAGDLETAAAVVDMALAASDETGEVWWDSALHRMRAELLFEAASGGPDVGQGGRPVSVDEAEREWLLALQLADSRGYPVHGVRAAMGYAGLLEHQNRVDDAHRTLETWLRRCPEGWSTPVLTTARSRLDDLERGARERSEERFSRGRGIPDPGSGRR